MEQLERLVLAVDVVMLTVSEGALRVLLVRRTLPPFADAWALPGVALRVDESLVSAARRALDEKVGMTSAAIDQLHLEQLVTMDGLYRDPRGRTVSVAYLGLAHPPGTNNRQHARWREVHSLGRTDLPFDHGEVVAIASARLRGKLRYTNIASRVLPPTFTMDQLEEVYRAVLGRALYRSNLRTTLLRLGLIERVRVLSEAVGPRGGRPPHLYRFASDDVEILDRDFV